MGGGGGAVLITGIEGGGGAAGVLITGIEGGAAAVVLITGGGGSGAKGIPIPIGITIDGIWGAFLVLLKPLACNVWKRDRTLSESTMRCC
jgi:hypothetical protein